MTRDEIKNKVSMQDVVKLYGISINRSGFCKCPFHTEKTASMKIYRDSYYCYGCSAHGDVFTFVQTIENCDFKQAYQRLGGSYDHPQNKAGQYAAQMMISASKAKQKIESLDKNDEDEIYQLLRETIKQRRETEDNSEPFSDEWCEAIDDLVYLDYLYEVVFFGKPTDRDIFDVYKQVRAIRQKRNIGA